MPRLAILVAHGRLECLQSVRVAAATLGHIPVMPLGRGFGMQLTTHLLVLAEDFTCVRGQLLAILEWLFHAQIFEQ